MTVHATSSDGLKRERCVPPASAGRDVSGRVQARVSLTPARRAGKFRVSIVMFCLLQVGEPGSGGELRRTAVIGWVRAHSAQGNACGVRPLKPSLMKAV